MVNRNMAHGRKISVIGLGYVGLPVALAFGLQGPVIGFDINARRLEQLRHGEDRTGEVSAENLAKAEILFTDDPNALPRADFHIVAVPTPIDSALKPDLKPLLKACALLSPHLKAGDVVVFESTVFPGASEEVCLPALEEHTELKAGRDFFLGYSPERINPGDTRHGFQDIVKVVSGQDPATLDIVAQVYESVVRAGVHRASSIKVAEAAKVIENTQRDLNIALMNELAMLFARLGLDTGEVLRAARTKWNFLPFEPGLVGGHCIGVDPYYLTHRAQQAGFHPEVILAGRRTNDGMAGYVASEIIKALIRLNQMPQQCTVTVLGLTFKEDVPDLRNSKVVDVVEELKSYQITLQLHDPLAEPDEVEALYGLPLMTAEALRPAQCVFIAVPHQDYRQGGWDLIRRLLLPDQGLVADLKSMLPDAPASGGPVVWRL